MSINQTGTCSSITAGSSIIIIGNNIYNWPTWQDTISTPSIIQERMEVENIRQQELQRIRDEDAEQRRLIDQKASEILLEHLTPEQRDTIEKNRWFVVKGGKSGKLYRINSVQIAGNVEELDGEKIVARYCCHLNHQYPRSDHHLAQKLMLEWDEEEFLRKANKRDIA
jgi:hypothetical protein